MNKGVVMEMTSDHIVVMTRDRQFIKIPQDGRSCEVGDDIVFSEPRAKLKRPALAFMSGVAAAGVFCVVAFLGLSGGNASDQVVVAYVSMDINPSVEVGIDITERVRETRGLNQDGVALLERFGDHRGELLEEFTGQLIEQATPYFSGEGGGDIIIASTQVDPKAAVNDEQLTQRVKATVEQRVRKMQPQAPSTPQVNTPMAGMPRQVTVTGLAVPPEVREQARTEGLSAGKYAIYLTAKSHGVEVSVQELQQDSVHKLAKDSGGLDRWIGKEKLPDKDGLKKLLVEEKEKKLGTDQKKSGSRDLRSTDQNNKDDQGVRNNAKPPVTPATPVTPAIGKSGVKTPSGPRTNSPTPPTRPGTDDKQNRDNPQGSNADNKHPDNVRSNDDKQNRDDPMKSNDDNKDRNDPPKPEDGKQERNDPPKPEDGKKDNAQGSKNETNNGAKPPASSDSESNRKPEAPQDSKAKPGNGKEEDRKNSSSGKNDKSDQSQGGRADKQKKDNGQEDRSAKKDDGRIRQSSLRSVDDRMSVNT